MDEHPMQRMRPYSCAIMLGAIALLSGATVAADQPLATQRIPWPEETHCLEMFSAMTEGPDGRIYAGTCNAVREGARLLSLDPKTKKQEVLADMQEVCGEVG